MNFSGTHSVHDNDTHSISYAPEASARVTYSASSNLLAEERTHPHSASARLSHDPNKYLVLESILLTIKLLLADQLFLAINTLLQHHS